MGAHTCNHNTWIAKEFQVSLGNTVRLSLSVCLTLSLIHTHRADCLIRKDTKYQDTYDLPESHHRWSKRTQSLGQKCTQWHRVLISQVQGLGQPQHRGKADLSELFAMYLGIPSPTLTSPSPPWRRIQSNLTPGTLEHWHTQGWQPEISSAKMNCQRNLKGPGSLKMSSSSSTYFTWGDPKELAGFTDKAQRVVGQEVRSAGKGACARPNDLSGTHWGREKWLLKSCPLTSAGKLRHIL